MLYFPVTPVINTMPLGPYQVTIITNKGWENYKFWNITENFFLYLKQNRIYYDFQLAYETMYKDIFLSTKRYSLFYTLIY